MSNKNKRQHNGIMFNGFNTLPSSGLTYSGRGLIGSSQLAAISGPISGFNVGDRILNVSPYQSVHSNMEAVVIENNGMYVEVRYDDGSTGQSSTPARDYRIVGATTIGNSSKIKISKLKIGDRVKCISLFSGKDLEGKTGKIVEIKIHGGEVGVEFDEDIEGHDCGGNSKDGHGRYGPAFELKKISKFARVKKLKLQHLDSLVIAEDVKKEIVSTLKQMENSHQIFNKWGLGNVIEYGRGMTFMFWGLPGTGKTYAANLMARTLGMELLIISAGDIQSSEPGAANRNIEQAFATAKEKNKVLFIDECDSLIFNREQLGMILASEVNTLLTSIEKFEGVCILATNRISDMDAALERRISLIVEFPMPTKEQRLKIWQNLMPKKLPIGDLDMNVLASYEISGGMIKNAVLTAARLAAAEKAPVLTENHFDIAIKRVLSSKNLMGTRKGQMARMDYSTNTKIEKIGGMFDDYLKGKK